jgi:hypothetical protein
MGAGGNRGAGKKVELRNVVETSRVNQQVGCKKVNTVVVIKKVLVRWCFNL